MAKAKKAAKKGKKMTKKVAVTTARPGDKDAREVRVKYEIVSADDRPLQLPSYVDARGYSSFEDAHFMAARYCKQPYIVQEMK